MSEGDRLRREVRLVSTVCIRGQQQPCLHADRTSLLLSGGPKPSCPAPCNVSTSMLLLCGHSSRLACCADRACLCFWPHRSSCVS
jgi:hypothetical protein